MTTSEYTAVPPPSAKSGCLRRLLAVCVNPVSHSALALRDGAGEHPGRKDRHGDSSFGVQLLTSGPQHVDARRGKAADEDAVVVRPWDEGGQVGVARFRPGLGSFPTGDAPF